MCPTFAATEFRTEAYIDSDDDWVRFVTVPCSSYFSWDVTSREKGQQKSNKSAEVPQLKVKNFTCRVKAIGGH